jgi:ABC-type multidrug transport system fused ATPase/permease subunit
MLPPKSFLLQKLSEPSNGGGASTPDAKKDSKATPPKSNLKWIASLAREEYVPLTFGVIGMSAASAMNLVFPKVMGKAIDVASGKPPPGGLSRKGFLFVVLTTFVTGSVGSLVRVYSLGMVAERIAVELRKRLYRILLAQETSFYHNRKVGELVSRLSGDCQVTANAVVEIMSNGFRSLNSAVGASCMLLTISPKLFLVSLSILPMVGTGAMVFSKLSSRLSKVHQNSVANMSGVVEERLNNIYTVKLFAAEEQEQNQFDEINKQILANASRAKRARGLFMGGLSFSINCSLFSVLYFGGSLVGKNELTIGSLTSFALYSGFMGLGFSGLSSCFSELKKTRESSSALFSLLELPPADEKNCKETLDQVKGLIRFEKVSFAYPSRPDALVLDGLDLEIQPGQVVAIVGKSGAGKTTIASLITKIIAPTHGAVTLDGVDIQSLSSSWLRKQIGVVNQEPSLFASTVADNITYGSPVRDEARVIAVAKEAHAHEFIMTLPNKYDTFVGEKGFELSGGQKQRIAIARALYKQTKILLFDEATSSLDGQSESSIRQAMESASQNRTVFIIAHRLNTIKHADRIILLEDGAIAETGTFDELNKEGSKFQYLLHSHSAML